MATRQTKHETRVANCAAKIAEFEHSITTAAGALNKTRKSRADFYMDAAAEYNMGATPALAVSEAADICAAIVKAHGKEPAGIKSRQTEITAFIDARVWKHRVAMRDMIEECKLPKGVRGKSKSETMRDLAFALTATPASELSPALVAKVKAKPQLSTDAAIGKAADQVLATLRQVDSRIPKERGAQLTTIEVALVDTLREFFEARGYLDATPEPVQAEPEPAPQPEPAPAMTPDQMMQMIEKLQGQMTHFLTTK